MWNQPVNQKCVPKSEPSADTPVITKTNGNLTLVGKENSQNTHIKIILYTKMFCV